MTTEVSNNEIVDAATEEVLITTNLKDIQCLFCDERYEDEHKLFNHLNYMHVIELVEFLAKRPIPRKVIDAERMITVNRSDISEEVKYFTLGVLDSLIGKE